MPEGPATPESAGAATPPHLRAFLLGWAAERDERVPSLWLEFDLHSGGDSVPSLCAKLRHPVDPTWLVESLLPALRGGPLTRRQREIALRCRREIPAGGQLLYAFCMLPRGGDLRLEVFGLSPEEMTVYLERIEAPGSTSELFATASLFAGVERTHLSFDVGPGAIRPRVGIAGSFPRMPGREPRWNDLLGRLEARGLCSREQREALFGWQGYESFWTAPGPWPAGRMRTFCVRYLSHLKLVHEPGREPEAKVYLAFGPYRREGGEGGPLRPDISPAGRLASAPTGPLRP